MPALQPAWGRGVGGTGDLVQHRGAQWKVRTTADQTASSTTDGGGDASPTVIALGKIGCVEAMGARFRRLLVHMPLHVTEKKDHIASIPSQNLASQEETKITSEMKTNAQLVGCWDFYNKATVSISSN